MKTKLLMALSLMAALQASAMNAAAVVPSEGPIGNEVPCGDAEDPNVVGLVPATEAYVANTGREACIGGEATQNAILALGVEAEAFAALTVDGADEAAGGVTGINPLDVVGAIVPAAVAAEAAIEDVALNAAHDTCEFAIGTNPNCPPAGGPATGGDGCPDGVEIPNPLSLGGAAGAAIDSGNAVLTSQCNTVNGINSGAEGAVETTVGTITPALGAVGPFATATVEGTLNLADNPGTIAGATTNAVFNTANQVQTGACIVTFGTPNCI